MSAPAWNMGESVPEGAFHAALEMTSSSGLSRRMACAPKSSFPVSMW